MLRGMIGRADLLYALAASRTPEEADGMTKSLGYERSEEPDIDAETNASDETVPLEPSVPPVCI